jgi:hypothetical protein
MTFGGSNISEKLFNFVVDKLPSGSTILEFGSGQGSTGQLSQHYKMYSIEHDQNYLNKYNSNYIHAPIVNGWYDVPKIKNGLPEKYDMILIDGPVGEGNRIPILNYLKLFDMENKWIIIDDTHRVGEIILFHELMKLFNVLDVYVGEDFSSFLGVYK